MLGLCMSSMLVYGMEKSRGNTIGLEKRITELLEERQQVDNTPNSQQYSQRQKMRDFMNLDKDIYRLQRQIALAQGHNLVTKIEKVKIYCPSHY